MKVSHIVVGLFLSGTATAVPASSYRVHERRDDSLDSSTWLNKTRASPGAKVPVHIALKQLSDEEGEEYLMEVSDPSSPKYGQHYTAEQVADLFAPSENTIKSVKKWLVASGVDANSITISKGGWLHFETPASHVESLLQTEFYTYSHAETKHVHFGASEYSLPHDIAPLVDLVLPGISLTKLQTKKKSRKPRPASRAVLDAVKENPDNADHCDTHITPSCIRALYGIPNATFADPSNKMGFFETGHFSFGQYDFDKFYAEVATNIPQGTGPEVHVINNGTEPTPAGTPSLDQESDLDFEVAIPIIYPQGTILYQLGNTPPANSSKHYDVFDDFLDALAGPFCNDHDAAGKGRVCNEFKPPNVLSVSYAGAEKPYLARFYKRQCTEWMKLGLLGTSVFFGSGDDGVAEHKCLGPKRNIFSPAQFPSCPYITAVGGTKLPAGGKVGDAEVAVESYSSGGGFSNVFPTPKYQQKAVSEYLANHVPANYQSYNTSDGVVPKTGGIYNAGGRGYPDISAVGDFGVTVVYGILDLWGGGTSMACPITAAIFNRINEERIHIGKGPVGFINPALYKAYDQGDYFNDVVSGNQSYRGCNGTVGFSAVPGWDPITGLGTPKYPKLLEYFLAL